MNESIKPEAKRDCVGDLLIRCALGHELKVLDTLSYGRAKLVCEHDAGKVLPKLLPAVRGSEEILILSEQHPAEFRRSRQERFVIRLARAILLTRQRINSPPAQTLCDCRWNVHVHVEHERHCGFRASSSARESCLSVRRAAASPARRRISFTNSLK